ncbi:MAG: hypothetical protein HOI88_03790 [Phycisphaerae bacterium]|jgi:hypothetical protein|nr:hypothetical protein [Phycisphaerae bacterium]MBT6269451.1 hypothetical protein [Phycisphaerae bacterium]MBT6283457.1 hypothetical protein [Phycisphaerae bacterium]
MSNTYSNDDSIPINFTAIVLGWLLPGLGHVSVGQKRRGFLIMGGALFLVFCGTLVGGIDAVDHNKDGLWFIAQVWCGPVVVGIDLLNQTFIAPLPIADKVTLVGLSHANEMGTLFIAMAGLMNFVVLLDVIHAKRGEDFELRSHAQDRRAS